ncbi:TetR/AcrR family transcriptional regulator [Corynebacterium pilosum]|nr:TetR/AcrR family transcriptional regulator [Corynebacterium pilosum]
MSTSSRPGVSATKQRILECSRELFSQESYAKVSLKDIAVAADVSVALIVKHFGSKGALFVETLDFSVSAQNLFSGEFSDLGRTAVAETLDAPHNAPYSMARTISIASGDQESLTAIGQQIRSDLHTLLAQRIRDEAPFSDPSPELRAHAGISLLIGLSFMRRLDPEMLASFSAESLLDFYGAKFQRIVDGEPN